MKLFWGILVLVLFIAGCMFSPTSNVLVEDISEGEVYSATEPAKANIIEGNIPEEEVSTEKNEKDIVEDKEDTKAEPAKETIEESEEEIIEGDEEENKVRIIEIINKAFVPNEMTVRPGTTVVWKHMDRSESYTQHKLHIYLIPGTATSPVMRYGDSFNYTFTEPKEYRFIDLIFKEDMGRGIIRVLE